MHLDTNTIIRLLTGLALGGLLLTVGMRLTWHEVRDALRRSHLAWLLPVNFVVVPLLTYGMIRLFRISPDIGAGMMLLAAAPFAPVVPIFARMSRADLALAAGLTALFPFVCSFLTPVVCKLGLHAVLGGNAARFSSVLILLILVLTITLPLSLGVLCAHFLPRFTRTIFNSLEKLSEGAGALSLGFVTVVELKQILHTGAMPLLAMALTCEIALAIGYGLSGPTPAIRRVTALGTSNRNIALALLVAVQSFPDTPVVAAVVANGLLLIGLGLIHVAWWRFASRGLPSGKVA
jgi:BASS family bile acid:Na+ symporter